MERISILSLLHVFASFEYVEIRNGVSCGEYFYMGKVEDIGYKQLLKLDKEYYVTRIQIVNEHSGNGFCIDLKPKN